MKIGTDESYLKIERSHVIDPYSSFLMECYHTDSHSNFSGSCNAVVFDSGEEVRHSLAAFERFEIQALEIPGGGGCRIVISRDSHGNIQVRYRIGNWKQGSDSGFEGLVKVDGEFSQGFIRELSELILGPSQ